LTIDSQAFFILPNFSTLTTKRFTGQYHESGLPGGEGLSYYNARWYDAQLGRFVYADTLVPDPGDPQDLNRMAYVRGNPLRFVDPTGHAVCIDADCRTVQHPNNGDKIVRNARRSWDVVDYILGVEMRGNLHSVPAKAIRTELRISNTALHLPFLIGAKETAVAAHAWAWALWIIQVRPNGPWDHKPMIQGWWGLVQTVEGTQYAHDLWSNIHYGYVGKGLGFTREELLWGAGLAQFADEAVHGFENPGYNGRLRDGSALKTRLDNPEDPAPIEFGIYLWDKYGEDLTREIFLQELADWPGLSMEQ